MEKPYKSFFESKTVLTEKQILLNTQKGLKEAKKRIAKIKEAEENQAEKIDAVIDALDDLVKDAIDELGSSSEVVSTLIDTTKNLEDQSDIENEEEIFNDEEIMTESEEDNNEDEEEIKERELFKRRPKKEDDESEDKDEEMKEEDEDSSEEKEDDDKKEESFSKYIPRFK